MKNDRTQQNKSNSITLFMLQNNISQLIEVVIMCIAYKLFIVVEMGYEVHGISFLLRSLNYYERNLIMQLNRY